jgi:hypothetical protein
MSMESFTALFESIEIPGNDPKALEAVAALKSGEVYGGEYNDAKDRLGRAFSRQGGVIINWYLSQPTRDTSSNEVESYLYYDAIPSSLSHVTAARVAKLQKLGPTSDLGKEFRDKIVSLISAWVPAAELLKDAKGRVVKGRRPAPPKPDSIPTASNRSAKIIENAVNEILKPHYGDLIKNLREHYVTVAERIVSRGVYASPIKEGLPYSPLVAWKDVNRDYETRSVTGTPTLKEGHIEIAYSLARAEAAQIKQGFVQKTISKVGGILDTKERSVAFVKTDIVSGELSHLTFEGTVSFEFKDGSGFNLSTNVIINYSKLGKGFYQYPSRFRNIRFSNAKVVPSLSQEEVFKQWAV